MSKLSDRIQEELKDPKFAKAWQETELEDQIKRKIIDGEIKSEMAQNQRKLK